MERAVVWKKVRGGGLEFVNADGRIGDPRRGFWTRVLRWFGILVALLLAGCSNHEDANTRARIVKVYYLGQTGCEAFASADSVEVYGDVKVIRYRTQEVR